MRDDVLEERELAELQFEGRIEELETELKQARSLLRKFMWLVRQHDARYVLSWLCTPGQLELYPFPDEAYLSLEDVGKLHRAEIELDSGVRAE